MCPDACAEGSGKDCLTDRLYLIKDGDIDYRAMRTKRLLLEVKLMTEKSTGKFLMQPRWGLHGWRSIRF